MDAEVRKGEGVRERERENRREREITLSDPGRVLSLRLTSVSTSNILVASAMDLGKKQ
jgi:hypothetical protein